jgi:hypothetical protein
METIEVVNIAFRLVLGAAASFLAILVWTKTRDLPWMLIVSGTIAAYISTVYMILTLFGLGSNDIMKNIYSSPLSTLITSVPTLLYIIAFAVMIRRKMKK